MIGSDSPETDAELILLLAELLEAMGVKGTRLRLASLGQPETRGEYRDELTAYLRAHEAELSAEVRARIDLNPMRAFDASDPGTQAVMASAPKLLDRLAPEDAEHFAAGPSSCSMSPESRTSSTRRWCAASTTTRARCSSSPATRSAPSRASAAAAAMTG